MIVCHGCDGGDPREFMYYKGRTYINGTKFTLKDSYIDNWTRNGKKIWKYAKFSGTSNGPDGLYYYFEIDRFTVHDIKKITGLQPGTKEFADFQMSYTPNIIVRPWELWIIDEITEPITISEKEEEERRQMLMKFIEHPNNDWDHVEMRVAWVVYIAAMIGSLIFTQFYIPWAIVTYIFYKYRKGIMG